MKGGWKPSPIYKHKCVILLKMGIMIIATALVLRVFLYRPSGFSTQSPLNYGITPTSIKEHSMHTNSQVKIPVHAIAPSNGNSLPNLNDDDSNEELEVPVKESVVSKNDSVPNLDEEGSHKVIVQKPVGGFSKNNSESNSTIGEPLEEKCDPFRGDWIPNPAGPSYTSETCDLIETPQDCIKNGRPDSGYLYWRWKPRNCDLPPFDAVGFLKMMRHKTWALIGDSISRNHVQALICTLSQVEKPVFIFHDEGWKSKGWKFPSYNMTIYVLWSPFLVKSIAYEDDDGVAIREIDLHLDKLDKKWTELYQNMDYMIFSTGKWFMKAAMYYENSTILGCHSCFKPNITELPFDFAYRKALRNTLNFIATSGHKGSIFFRTSTPDHFEGGTWDTGGFCNRTIPFKEGETEIKDVHTYLRRVELEEFESASTKASQNGVRLKLLDFMQLSLLRPDGHPGPYRQYHPFAGKDKNAKVQNDCLHWCLPGPIDSWNDVIMDMVAKG